MIDAKTVEVIKAVDACLQVADEKFGTELAGNVRVRCDIRGFRTAGQAVWRNTIMPHNGKKIGAYDFELRLHPVAISEHWEKTLTDTIPHEVAHLVCAAKPSLGGKSHNRIWKMVDRALGGTGNRCHSLNLGAPSKDERREKWKARRPYVYVDDKGTERRVTKQKHFKIQRGYGYRWRDNGGLVDSTCHWKHDPYNPQQVISNTQKAAPKKRKVAKRIGGKTKADICRALIREFYGKVHDDILIDKIAHEAGLKKALAKTYFNNNLSKAW